MIPAFQEADELSKKDLLADEPVDAIWKSRFESFAMDSRVVTVVDRYAGASLMREGRESGLSRLLHYLNGVPGICELNVFCARRDYRDQDVIATFTNYVEELPRENPRCVTLYLLHDAQMAHCAHGRWIRFDRAVFQIDVGLEVLQAEKNYRNAQFTLKYLSKIVRNQERQLRQWASKHEIRALP